MTDAGGISLGEIWLLFSRPRAVYLCKSPTAPRRTTLVVQFVVAGTDSGLYNGTLHNHPDERPRLFSLSLFLKDHLFKKKFSSF